MAENVSLFKVIDVVKRTGINKYGEIEQYYDVYFETKSGIKSNITVSADKNEKEIEEIVKKEAEKLEYIARLKM